MVLQDSPTFPTYRCYVVKLHRDAAPALGRLCGRIEHIASGDRTDFASGADLLAWLAAHALQVKGTLAGNDAS